MPGEYLGPKAQWNSRLHLRNRPSLVRTQSPKGDFVMVAVVLTARPPGLGQREKSVNLFLNHPLFHAQKSRLISHFREISTMLAKISAIPIQPATEGISR